MNKSKKTLFFIIGLTLFLDGLLLMIFRKTIHLGTVLPLMIGLIFMLWVVFYKNIHQFLTNHQKLKKLYTMSWGLFWAWVLSVALFFGFIAQYSTTPNTNTPSAMIVLGSQVKNGKPSPALQMRLDKAIEMNVHYPNTPIIVTGGIGFGNTESEASVMGRYLIENGVDKALIIYENQSTSTELNLKNSLPLLSDNNIKPNQIAIITNDFHSIRAKKIAIKLGYQNVISISAPTPIITRYNSWLREYFAFISGWVLGEY